MDRATVDRIRKTVAQEFGARMRASRKHEWLDFPDWYLNEIERLSKKYRPIRYMPLAVPKFELDREEFLEFWDKEAIDILRTEPDVAEPWTKETHPMGENSNWHVPQFKGLDIWYHDPSSFYTTRAIPWTKKLKSHPMFDPLIEQLMDTMPFHSISNLYIWESTRDVPPHRDSYYYWDMPTEFRIMLNDDNDPVTEPTLYVADIDHGDINYVHLPADTNAFCWSNGSQLHGSDYHGKRKQLLCINCVFSISKYEKLMDASVEKYKDQLNYDLQL